jgi:ubiquinone/menaquinone biosynthesis C-methylase UbiE
MSVDPKKCLKAEIARVYSLISRKPSFSYLESQPRNWRKELASHERFAAQIVQQLRGLTGSTKYRRVLDVGCGMGDLVLAFSKRASIAVGIDPDPLFIKAAKLKAAYLQRKRARFVRARAECIPFSDDYFDLVLSNTTLEQVMSVEKSLAEMARVLKPGGWMYIVAPNYFWIWEGHYMLFMPPLFPKPLFKLYARLAGKDPEFIQHINYLTPWRVERTMRKLGLRFKNLSPDRYYKILVEQSEELPPHSKRMYGWLIKALSRAGISRPLYVLMSLFGFYPSLIYLAQKPAEVNR